VGKYSEPRKFRFILLDALHLVRSLKIGSSSSMNMIESLQDNSIQKASNHEQVDQRTQSGKLLLIGAGLKHLIKLGRKYVEKI